MKDRAGQKIRLTSVEEMLGVSNEESAMEISLAKIRPFKDHPFKVLDDDKMQELVESIRENGILTPVLLRPVGNDVYEMVSGHRRMHAAALLEMDAIPAIIREMTDDEAVVRMVDSNIQREELLPSEKAFAYKMKMDAMRRQGAREDLTCVQNGHKFQGKKSREIIASEVGESSQQVRRYIRLTELIPDLLDLVDRKRIQFTVGVEISYLDKEIQQWIYEYIKENGVLKLKQVTALREQLKDGGAITQAKMIALFQENQPGGQPASGLTFTEKRLRQYFPPDYTAEQMRTVIEDLLKEWRLKESEA